MIRSGALGRAAPAALLVVAASAVVAVAAGGTGLFVPPASLNAAWLKGARIGGAVAALLGMGALIFRGRRLREEEDRDFDATGSALAAAAMIMSVVALMAFLAPRMGFGRPGEDGSGRSGRRDGVNDARSGLTSFPPLSGMTRQAEGEGRRNHEPGNANRFSRRVVPMESPPEPADPRVAALRKAGNAILLVVLFFAAIIGLRMLTGWGGEDEDEEAPPEDEELPVAAVDAVAGLLASLGDVANEGHDPRLQITVAYHRLLHALALAGAPREPQEAPHEYLLRALGPLGVRPGPMHRLAGLYVMAQFSEHPVTERHRAQAVEALEAGLDDLRAHNEAVVPAFAAGGA